MITIILEVGQIRAAEVVEHCHEMTDAYGPLSPYAMPGTNLP